MPGGRRSWGQVTLSARGHMGDAMIVKTLKPNTALSLLVLLSFIGVILLAGEMVVAGAGGGSWLLIIAGAVMAVGGFGTIWKAWQEVRVGLKES